MKRDICEERKLLTIQVMLFHFIDDIIAKAEGILKS